MATCSNCSDENSRFTVVKPAIGVPVKRYVVPMIRRNGNVSEMFQGETIDPCFLPVNSEAGGGNVSPEVAPAGFATFDLPLESTIFPGQSFPSRATFAYGFGETNMMIQATSYTSNDVTIVITDSINEVGGDYTLAVVYANGETASQPIPLESPAAGLSFMFDSTPDFPFNVVTGISLTPITP